jgi:Smr domain
MKFQVGDIVLVKHSEEEAEVIDIINDRMVMVDVRGVKFPAYTDQLDFPYFKRFSQARAEEAKAKPKKFVDDLPKEKKNLSDKTQTGIWLTFIPVMTQDDFGDEVVDELKIHLVNRTDKTFRFEYSLVYQRGAGFEFSNTINAFQDFYIHDIPFENVNDSPAFHVVFSLQPPDKKEIPAYETVLKLKPKSAFAKIQQIRQKGEATFSHLLLETYPDNIVEEEKPGMDMGPLTKAGYKVYPASSARQHLEPAKYELDLHIEKLTGHPEKLSNFEMLTLQLQTLEKYLDLAIAHHQSSMIVIHGLGTGKLRDEIHEILRLKRDIKSFVNRYHPAYGYGATEIFFQY